METIDYHNAADRSQWPSGEWSTEPDKRQWQDTLTGLPCLIVRNALGALCGYVGVSETHPMYGKTFNDKVVESLAVHGGVTFTDSCQHSEENHGICHIPAPGEPDNVWWIGFDCSHSGDASPNYILPKGIRHKTTYRNFAYVTEQCAALAAQLHVQKT